MTHWEETGREGRGAEGREGKGGEENKGEGKGKGEPYWLVTFPEASGRKPEAHSSFFRNS